jgi:hypothetical protein
MAIKISDLTREATVTDLALVEVSESDGASPEGFTSKALRISTLRAATARKLLTLLNTTSSAAVDAAPADSGVMHVFTGTGAKSLTFDNADAWEGDHVYHVSNRAASGNLTLVGTGFTLSPPKGGTLVLAPGDTVTVHIQDVGGSPATAYVYGSTVSA